MGENSGERLIIDNFAGMKHVELDLGRLNLLIGPQGAGKSVCAKLLFLFKSILEIMKQAILGPLSGAKGEPVREAADRAAFDLAFLEKFKSYFPRETWPSQGAFSIRYKTGNASISVTCSAEPTEKPRLEYTRRFSEAYDAAAQRYGSLVRDASGEELARAGVWLRREIESILEIELGMFPQHFVPAGRSYFAAVESTIFNLLASPEPHSLDPFLLRFGRDYQYPRGHWQQEEPEERECLRDLNQRILGAKHELEKNRDFLWFRDGRRIPLANASSGEQEVLPLVIMLNWLANSHHQSGGETVYIEEPEAHLFPTAQKNIVELIATVFNLSDNLYVPLKFVITTHSPYILTAFNNLLQAGALAESLPDEKIAELQKIVPREQILSPSVFRAYALRDGGQEDLMDRETGLISADVIDEVSNSLAVQFGKLLDVE